MKETIKDKIFDQPKIFDFIRSLLMGGFTKISKEVSKYVTKEDSVLDVCCGSGKFSSIHSKDYCGIDLCDSFISYARKKYKKTFIVKDVCKMDIDNKFDIILFICSLHHFSNNQTNEIFNKLNQLANKKILVVDIIPPSRWNLLSRCLYRLDRGKWIRTLEEQQTLLKKHFIIKSKKNFQSFLYKFVIFECLPKNN